MPAATWSTTLLATGFALATATSAHAAPEGEAKAGGSVSLGADGAKAGADADASADKGAPTDADTGAGSKRISTVETKTPWMRKYKPERNMAELGVYGGLLIVSDDHDFFHPSTAPQIPLWKLGPDVGARVGFYPLSFLGVEVEGGVMPTKARTDLNESVLLYGVRGHAILQLPYRVAPFILGGYGMVGVSSEVVGNDIDPVGHYGIGAKIYINKWLMARIDGRHLIGAYQGRQRGDSDNGGGAFTNHFQILAGLSVTLGRKKPAAPPKDSDGDFYADADDTCPYQPGLDPDGCPVGDGDGDQVLDNVDACPTEAGVLPDGCPIRDSDGDGFMDPDDACPTEAGVEPDGCPIRDKDGDGILDEVDKCPDEPETKNGYEDADGCPDEIPEQIKEFTGVIEGIYFEFNSDKIRKKSEAKLKKAADVLKEFPDIRVEISGHTDNIGDRDVNLDLSRRRAESVRQWLVDNGIDGSRITTRGAGPDEPIDTNDTKAGQAKNRRIEFKVLTD
ncbi:MAG: OmpA family protein [Nannocystaceae bacterium]